MPQRGPWRVYRPAAKRGQPSRTPRTRSPSRPPAEDERASFRTDERSGRRPTRIKATANAPCLLINTAEKAPFEQKTKLCLFASERSGMAESGARACGKLHARRLLASESVFLRSGKRRAREKAAREQAGRQGSQAPRDAQVKRHES